MSPKSGLDSSPGDGFDLSGGIAATARDARVRPRPSPRSASDPPVAARPGLGARSRAAQPASIQIRLSWNGAPPTGATGSAPVRALMPIPSSNARFGQMLSTITTPG